MPIEWNAEIASTYRTGSRYLGRRRLGRGRWLRAHAPRRAPALAARQQVGCRRALLAFSVHRSCAENTPASAPTHISRPDVACAVDAAPTHMPRAVPDQTPLPPDRITSLASTSNALPGDALKLLTHLGTRPQATGLAALRRDTFGGRAERVLSQIIEGLLDAGRGAPGRIDVLRRDFRARRTCAETRLVPAIARTTGR